VYEASLVYKVSSWTARAIQIETLSRKTKKKKKKKKILGSHPSSNPHSMRGPVSKKMEWGATEEEPQYGPLAPTCGHTSV
jgi:hypothetical protein